MHNPWQSSFLFHKWPYRDVNKTLERVIPGELYFKVQAGVLMKNCVLPGNKYLQMTVKKLYFTNKLILTSLTKVFCG